MNELNKELNKLYLGIQFLSDSRPPYIALKNIHSGLCDTTYVAGNLKSCNEFTNKHFV